MILVPSHSTVSFLSIIRRTFLVSTSWAKTISMVLAAQKERRMMLKKETLEWEGTKIILRYYSLVLTFVICFCSWIILCSLSLQSSERCSDGFSQPCLNVRKFVHIFRSRGKYQQAKVGLNMTFHHIPCEGTGGDVQTSSRKCGVAWRGLRASRIKSKKLDTVGIEPTTFHRIHWNLCEAKIIPWNFVRD